MTTIVAASTRMAADMREQPSVLTRIVERRPRLHDALRAVTPDPLRGIALVGRGSSGNAALYGRILLEAETGALVTLVPPSLARLSRPGADRTGFLAFGLSQSGRTTEIGETLAALRARGATTVGIMADPEGPLAQFSDLVIDLACGGERAVPATKTFTAELAVLAAATEALSGAPWPDATWRAMVRAVARALDDEDTARAVAARIDATALSVIGAGVFVGVALEGALKLLEAARIAATGWSAASFRHGPMTLAGPGHPVIAIRVEGKAGDDVRHSLTMIEAAPVITVSDDPTADLPIDGGLPEALAAIPAAVRLQQVALAVAVRRGVDPDRPPRLKKVTLA